MKNKREKNPLYYWETENSHGQYRAENDEKALEKMPKNCWILYKESDTKDGQPFIILYEYKEENEDIYNSQVFKTL